MSNDPDVIKTNGLRLNGTANPTTSNEVKTPFLIGVAGGTASGKVSAFCLSTSSSHAAHSIFCSFAWSIVQRQRSRK